MNDKLKAYLGIKDPTPPPVEPPYFEASETTSEPEGENTPEPEKVKPKRGRKRKS